MLACGLLVHNRGRLSEYGGGASVLLLSDLGLSSDDRSVNEKNRMKFLCLKFNLNSNITCVLLCLQ